MAHLVRRLVRHGHDERHDGGRVVPVPDRPQHRVHESRHERVRCAVGGRVRRVRGQRGRGRGGHDEDAGAGQAGVDLGADVAGEADELAQDRQAGPGRAVRLPVAGRVRAPHADHVDLVGGDLHRRRAVGAQVQPHRAPVGPDGGDLRDGQHAPHEITEGGVGRGGRDRRRRGRRDLVDDAAGHAHEPPLAGHEQVRRQALEHLPEVLLAGAQGRQGRLGQGGRRGGGRVGRVGLVVAEGRVLAGRGLVLDVEARLAQATGQGRGQEPLLTDLVVGRPRLGLPRAGGGGGPGRHGGGGPCRPRARGRRGQRPGGGRCLLDDDAPAGQGAGAVGVKAGDG